MQKTTCLSCIPLAIALGFTSCTSLLSDVTQDITRTFKVEPGGTLTLDVDRGSIDIKTTDTHEVEILIQRKVRGGSRQRAEELLAAHKIDFSQTGNDVRVQAKYEGDSKWFRGWRGSQLNVHYLITTPKHSHVDLKTAGGSIRIDDLQGKARARTSGGSLKLGSIRGPIWGQTSGGSISVEHSADSVDVQTSGGSVSVGRAEGAVTARTSGGSIRLGQVAGDVVAKTSGGNIEVQEVNGTIDASTSGGSVSAKLASQPEGDCALKTSGGSIDVRLAGSLALNLDASTSGGQVVTDMPMTVQGEIKRNSVKSRINGGGPALLLRSSGGNVHIRKL